MLAKIIMKVGKEEIEYGTYPFTDADDKDKVNRIAELVKKERDVPVFVRPVRE